MKIAVVGTGYVGLVTGLCLAEKGHEVQCVDVDENKIEKLRYGKSTIYEPMVEELLVKNLLNNKIRFTTDCKKAYKDAEVIFIAVGTPEREDGSANLDYLFNVCKDIIASIEKNTVVVIKSTVPVGTNDKIDIFINSKLKDKGIKAEIVSNPEFLSQGSAVRDTIYPSRIVIGTNADTTIEVMKKIYCEFKAPIIVVDRRSAEMIKYASNDFLALKISFINEIANFCEIVGANINDVTRGMSYDKRVGKEFLKAGLGYGGSCFPKDTKALHWMANDNGYEIKTVKAAIEVNENQKYKLYRKAKKVITSFQNKKIAVLGVTFKPNTDDLREAPSIPNIKRFIEDGAIVTAYDPVGIDNLKKIFKDKIKYSSSIKGAINDADATFIFTEWNEIKKFDINKYSSYMKDAYIFDGRACYDLKNIKSNNIYYYSIGRKTFQNRN